MLEPRDGKLSRCGSEGGMGSQGPCPTRCCVMDEKELNENFRQQYEEVCRSYHAIHDFRAKLLALLPLASGVSGVVLLLKETILQKYFTPIGIFSAIVTLGLYVYEARGTQRCHELKKNAQELEVLLGMNSKTGQFLGEPKPVFNVVREGVAGAIIYTAVFVGWILLGIFG